MRKLFLSLFFLVITVLVISAQSKSTEWKSFNGETDDSINTLVAVFQAEQDSIRQQLLKEPYPDFEAISLDNDTITRSKLNGKVTIINFWFEGCAPCLAELRALSNLYNKYSNNPFFQFLSFTIDDIEVAQKAVNKYKIPFTVCPVSRKFASIMNFNSAFPTNIIINKKGKVEFFRASGYIEIEKVEKDIAQIDDVIAQMLLCDD